jgi:hypothetical protein
MDTAGIMKQLLTTVLLMGCLPIFAQHLAMADKRLAMESDSVDYWYMRYRQDYKDTIAYGRFEFFSQSFDTDLLQVLNMPGSVDYDFKELGQRITITASADKKLRAFSWDTYMGGTMKDLKTVFQYKTPSGSKTKIFMYTEDGADADPELMQCLEIFSIETKSGMVYIPHTFMTESSLYHYQTVKFLKIEGEELQYTSLLNLDRELVYSHGVEYIAYYNDESKPKNPIEYDSKRKILSFVKTDDKQNVTNSFDRYRFNGKYFEKEK